MAAESHKELQKCQDFGDWVRKDIQYSQFQNYELTYGHFVRFPSWGHWPPGSSPGTTTPTSNSSKYFKSQKSFETKKSFESSPQLFESRKRSETETNYSSVALLFFSLFLKLFFLSASGLKTGFLQSQPVNLVFVLIWICLDEILLSMSSRAKLNLCRLIANNIRSRLQASKWNWKISWLKTSSESKEEMFNFVGLLVKTNQDLILSYSLAIS